MNNTETPCERHGYKVGDSFIIIVSDTFKGCPATLTADDGTSIPKFEVVKDGQRTSRFISLSRVKKLTSVSTDNVQSALSLVSLVDTSIDLGHIDRDNRWKEVAKVLEQHVPDLKWASGNRPGTGRIYDSSCRYVAIVLYDGKVCIRHDRDVGGRMLSSKPIWYINFIDNIVKQFGATANPERKEEMPTIPKDAMPSYDRVCGKCGKRYGEHHGENCPNKKTTFSWTGRYLSKGGDSYNVPDRALKDTQETTKKVATETKTVAKEKKVKKDMKQIATEVADINKDSLKIAGKIVAGQTIINRIRKLADAHIPATGVLRKVWDSAFGDLVISNLLLVATRFYPDNPKLNNVAEMTNLAAAVSTKDKLDVQGMIDRLLDGIELPGFGDEKSKDKK